MRFGAVGGRTAAASRRRGFLGGPSMEMTGRRDFLSVSLALASLVAVPPGVRADGAGCAGGGGAGTGAGGLSILVALKEGSEPPPKGSSAIYVTARLAGKIKGFATGRELSPVLSIRVPADDLDLSKPVDIVFSDKDVTPEGAEDGGSWWLGKVRQKTMSRVLIFPFFLLLHPCVHFELGIHWERTPHAVACLPTWR
jgi:hypothetical protein